MAEWQPIESAPKDGTLILSFVNEHHPSYIFAFVFWDDGYWISEDPDGGSYSPTHWMPLPNPPSGE